MVNASVFNAHKTWALFPAQMQMSRDLGQIASLLQAWRGLAGDAADTSLAQELCSPL